MRRLTVVAVVAALFVTVLAVPASADKLIKETDRFTDTFEEVIPANPDFPGCEFDVGVSERVKGSETLWSTPDDELVKAHVKLNGTTTWSGPGGSVTERWAWSGWFDAASMTFRQSGNVWNLHQNGLILHDKGLIVFDTTTGDVIKVAGPHEVFDEGLGALCEVIG